MPPAARRLIVNADDFGFARSVNEGILEAHRHGILRAASLLAVGPAFEHAVALAHATPTLDVGAHLALTGMPSALDGRPLPATLPQLIRALALGLPIYQELAAQIRRILAAGLHPSHLDTHKHAHLLPPVLEAVIRLAEEFQIPWIRRPFDFRWPDEPPPAFRQRLASALFALFRPAFDRRLRRSPCRTTDHFAGLRLTGRFGVAELVRLIHALPPGLTEFMCHPGFHGPDLDAAPTRLKQSRARELAALTSPRVFEALGAAGVELATFRAGAA